MTRWRRPVALVWLAGSTLAVLAACGGRSEDDDEPGDGRGASSGVAGASVAGGAPSSAGGVIGSAGVSGASGCIVDGKHYEEGASWPKDCNTCYCKDSRASCTEIGCAGGPGGSPGVGGGVGTSGAGGQPNQCRPAELASFCVHGLPAPGTGQSFTEGMELVVSFRPSGCHSSSCTKVVSSECNSLGSDRTYWVSGFLCLTSEGDACTDDCGGGESPMCKPGITLERGEYTIGLGGSTIAIKLTVPSTVDGELCASREDGASQ